MDLFKRIQDLSAVYDDDGPSSMVPESRPMFNDGGMLVKPSADGSRPGYKGERVYNSPDVDTFSDALLDAYAKDDITKIVESGKSTKFANVITAIESGKDKSAKLAKVIKNTGLDEETIFNLLDDRKAYIDLAREGGPAGANPRAGNFYRKAENWITTNSKRYADPDKFKKAFIRTFGTNNDLIKTMKKLNVPGARKQTSVPFSSWFKETILGSTKGSDAGYNFNQLNNIFKTSIYTNNETVRNKLTKEINRILSIPLEKGGKFDIRNEIKNSPLFKKFGFDKQIRGPIARLLANEIGQELLDQVSSFRDPYLGTTELIRFLKNNVDPKYKSMFEEAAKAADLAAKNKWPEAKQILKIKDNIMFDHKIPKELVKLGYADELEYIKLNPTSAEFNTRIKNPEFDQKIIKLAKDFERTTSLDGKAKVVEKMNILKNNFSKKYGGYLDEVSIIPDKTGKPIFKSSAAPVTKQTDFVSSLGKSMVQAGEISEKDFKKLMVFCPAGTAKVTTKAGGGRVPYADGPVCTPDEAIRGMNEEFDKIKKGNATAGEASRTINKFKNLGVKGMSGLLKAGLVSEVAFEAAVGFDRVISEGQSPMQAFRQSYLTAPLRAIGAMKSFEEGEREEILAAARDKGKVGRVLDLQNLVGDKNKLASNIEGLKSNVENLQRLDDGDFGYMGGTQGQEDALASAQANLQDMYRSGELSRAEQLFSTKPQDLKLKDKTLMDAYNDAIEKRKNIQAERGSIAQSVAADENRIRDRMNAEGILTIQDAKNELKNIGDYYGRGYTPYGLNKLYEDAEMQNPGFGIEKVGPRTGKYNEEKGLQDYLNSMKMQKIADAGGVANMAGGGIAKMAGDRSGPPPESGPNSQGLQGLFNRVKKV